MVSPLYLIRPTLQGFMHTVETVEIAKFCQIYMYSHVFLSILIVLFKAIFFLYNTFNSAVEVGFLSSVPILHQSYTWTVYSTHELS